MSLAITNTSPFQD